MITTDTREWQDYREWYLKNKGGEIKLSAMLYKEFKRRKVVDRLRELSVLIKKADC